MQCWKRISRVPNSVLHVFANSPLLCQQMQRCNASPKSLTWHCIQCTLPAKQAGVHLGEVNNMLTWTVCSHLGVLGKVHAFHMISFIDEHRL